MSHDISNDKISRSDVLDFISKLGTFSPDKIREIKIDGRGVTLSLVKDLIPELAVTGEVVYVEDWGTMTIPIGDSK